MKRTQQHGSTDRKIFFPEAVNMQDLALASL